MFNQFPALPVTHECPTSPSNTVTTCDNFGTRDLHQPNALHPSIFSLLQAIDIITYGASNTNATY